jgi:hypothetical protein
VPRSGRARAVTPGASVVRWLPNWVFSGWRAPRPSRRFALAGGRSRLFGCSTAWDLAEEDQHWERAPGDPAQPAVDGDLKVGGNWAETVAEGVRNWQGVRVPSPRSQGQSHTGVNERQLPSTAQAAGTTTQGCWFESNRGSHCPSYKVKPRARGRFRSHPEAASGVDVSGASADIALSSALARGFARTIANSGER